MRKQLVADSHISVFGPRESQNVLLVQMETRGPGVRKLMNLDTNAP
jgi:hypothetical protein